MIRTILLLGVIIALMIGFATVGYMKGFDDARSSTATFYREYMNESCMCVSRDLEQEGADYYNLKIEEVKKINWSLIA